MCESTMLIQPCRPSVLTAKSAKELIEVQHRPFVTKYLSAVCRQVVKVI